MSIKQDLIRGIGLNVIERPRELQGACEGSPGEHKIVHQLYRLQKQGLVEFRTKRNLHSPGNNLTSIRLTPQGARLYEELSND